MIIFYIEFNNLLFQNSVANKNLRRQKAPLSEICLFGGWKKIETIHQMVVYYW